MYLVTLGVKSHLKKGDRGFACSQDIHDDHIRFFQMVQFPSGRLFSCFYVSATAQVTLSDVFSRNGTKI